MTTPLASLSVEQLREEVEVGQGMIVATHTNHARPYLDEGGRAALAELSRRALLHDELKKRVAELEAQIAAHVCGDSPTYESEAAKALRERNYQRINDPRSIRE